MKHKLILRISKLMDTNKKKDTREAGLIRFGAKAREHLGLSQEKTVELWPSDSSLERINRSRLLEIHESYSKDLSELKAQVGVSLTEDEYLRTGFVTTSIFNSICKSTESSRSIWAADNIDDTVIGGDPEFILIHPENNSVVYAGNINGFTSEGKLGSDGPLAELRPDPAISVEEFVDNISSIFKTHPKTKYIENLKWMAGCCWITPDNHNGRDHWPIGGHIHVGTPNILYKKMQNGQYFKSAVFQTMVKAIDELLAIPLLKLEKQKYASVRRESYGYFGDYRTDRDRLEYRTISGAWLTHPKIATYVLGTVKAIIDSYFHLLEEHNFDSGYVMKDATICGRTQLFSAQNADEWHNSDILKDLGTVRTSSEMVDILNKGTRFDKSSIAKMYALLKALPSYNKYSQYVDGLMALISIPAKDLKLNHDIKVNWVEGKELGF